MDTPIDIVNLITSVLQTFGLPGVLAGVIAYALRKAYTWVSAFWREHAWPYIEKAVQAYLSRQATMEECTKQLTEKTIEIQQQVLTTVLRMEEKFPGLCRNRDSSQH